MKRREFVIKGGGILTLPMLTGVYGRGAEDSHGAGETGGIFPPPIDEQDHEQRREKARRLLRENGLDALFLTGSSDLIYFSGVRWWRSERTFGMILPVEGDPVWICPAFELDRAEERIPGKPRVLIWQEEENPFQLVARALSDSGGGGKRLALGPTVRFFVLDGLKKSAPQLELVNGAVVTEGCRGIKTKKEIACMDYANRLTKKAYKTAFSRLRAGMSPEALGREVSSAHQNLGVKGGGWPSFGPNSAFPHGSSRERNLESGDVVLIDGGCGVHGYRSDVTRTIVYGQATDKQKRVWDTVKKAQDSAYKAIRPGVPCEEIDRVARRVTEEAGFGAGYAHFTHRLGHGIGLDGHEYPYLVKGNTLRLQPGMTFSNEPGIYIPGEFGIRIEDCFVVTDGGYRVLGGMESLAIDRPFAET